MCVTGHYVYTETLIHTHIHSYTDTHTRTYTESLSQQEQQVSDLPMKPDEQLLLFYSSDAPTPSPELLRY